MGKALLGSTVDPATLRLLDEVRALRRRVAELEAALAAADAASLALEAADLGADGRSPVGRSVDVTEREHADA